MKADKISEEFWTKECRLSVKIIYEESKVIEAVKKLLQKKFSRFKIWHFECIQQHLKDRLRAGERLSPFLEWCAHYDFLPHRLKKEELYPQINWRELYSTLRT